MKFDNYYWHDALVRYISIDRSNPGIVDEICFEIHFPDEGEKTLKFIDVYWAELNLNFGIIAQETILCAFQGPVDDADIVKIRNKWKGHLSRIELNAYNIEFNSTASKMKIIAKDFSVA